MMRSPISIIFTVILALLLQTISAEQVPAQEESAGSETRAAGSASPAKQAMSVVSVKPDYLSPIEILDFLGVISYGNSGIFEWNIDTIPHTVEVRHNDAANLIILSGETRAVEHVANLIAEADVPPHQIEIEVKIVEISNSLARDLGIDWEDALTSAMPRASGALPSAGWRYTEASNDQQSTYKNQQSNNSESVSRYDREDDRYSRQLSVSSNLDLSRVVKLLDESGVATVHNVPRILTLNNRPAQILDGQRVTYVTRYSAYSNLYETETMDAGLTLNLIPSVGESGFITLQIHVELTELGRSIADSPTKNGQLIENTVIVRDGEAVLLGGLTRTSEQVIHKRFPVLGHIIPYLFSRKITLQQELEVLMILTPRVVDIAASLDDRTKSILEGESGQD